MRYAIGDVHGELSKLEALVDHIRARDPVPEFLFVGDYVDKGEDSLATLRYLSALNQTDPCVFLIGNHDYFWKYYASDPARHDEFLTKFGGLKTQSDFGARTIREAVDRMSEEFGAFMQSWRLYWESEHFLLTHSGLARGAYQKPAEEFTAQDVLFNRFDFIAHGERYRGKTVVFGHTGFYSVFSDGLKIGVDTGACYSRLHPLTAFCLDDAAVLNSFGSTFSLGSIPTGVWPCVIRHKPSTLMDLPYDNFIR